MLIKQHSLPEILVHRLVNPDDVQKLFNMYVFIAHYFVIFPLTELNFIIDFINVLM